MIRHSMQTAKSRFGFIKGLAKRVLAERSSPARLGVAVGLGVFIGVVPVYGLHLLLCFVFASLLGVNRAVTYLAAHISVPWIAPFLILGGLQTGSLVLHGSWLSISLDELGSMDVWRLGEMMALGSVLFGLLLGVPAGVSTWLAVRAYRRRNPLPADPLGETMETVAERYRPFGRVAFAHIRSTFKHDPVYRQLAHQQPLASPVLDIGCRYGQAALLLHRRQPELQVHGIGWDTRKLALARRAAGDTGQLTFARGDIRNEPLPQAGTILLIDVLQHHPPPIQDALLARAAAAVAPGGALFLRELDAAAGWRARLMIWQQRLGRRLRVGGGTKLYFRPVAELAAVLEGAGLAVRYVPAAAESLPLASVLLRADRPASSR